jgi:Ca2+-binding RTX toxin-like protein
MRSLLAKVPIIAAAGLLLTAGAAHAAGTVTRDGTEYTYAGTGSDANDLMVTVLAIPIVDGVRYEAYFSVAGAGDTVTTTATGCSNTDPQTVKCLNNDDVSHVTANGNGGVDKLSFDDGQRSIFEPPCFNCVSRPVTFDGGPGNDTVNGSAANDILRGDTGTDTLTGGTGRDNIQGGDDNDVMTGGLEDDVVLDGGAGSDRARYDEPGRVGGVTVDLGSASGKDGGAAETNEDAVDVERVTGTAAGDTITGNGAVNILDGAGGPDTLAGAGGGDTLNGQAGPDVLDGGLGPDVLDGGADADTADYSTRLDGVTVTIATDGLADDGNEQDGPAGARDSVANVERLLGGAGGDTLRSLQGVAVELVGNGGDDLLVGTPANDVLAGGPGADTIDGAAGRDSASYAEPQRTAGVTVTLGSGTGDDGSAFDQNFVGARDTVGNVEILDGTRFSDVLAGDGSANDLRGGGGDDVLRGGGAADVLAGGAGVDTASYEERGGGVVVTLDGVANDGAAGENDRVGADVEAAAGGAGADALTGNDGPNALRGGGGADTLTGAGGVDSYAAGAGDDAVRAVDGNAEPVDCGAGSDSAEVDAADAATGCEAVHRVSLLIDADRDGFPAGAGRDCDDTNPAVNPGARDVPGNGVDEDCTGGPAPFTLIDATIASSFGVRGARTHVNALTVKRLPAGARVVLTCKPPSGARRACPFRRIARSFTATRRRLALAPAFRDRALRVGTRLEIRVTAPEQIGKLLRFRTRDGALPRKRSRCLVPGAARPSRC